MTTTPIALVTGASSGIGLATAEKLAAAGFQVFAAARRTAPMEALRPAGVVPLAMDVTDTDSLQAGLALVLAQAGRLDVLVNNAGYGSYGPVECVPMQEARRQFDVNVFGLAALTQLALPHLRAQRSGRIINVSSIGGKIYEPLGAWYHATKFAVEGFSDSLRLELAPFGIDVVIVEPGPVATEWNSIARDSMIATSQGSAYAERAEKMARTYAQVDEKRSSKPEEIAAVIVKAATARRPKTRYPAGKQSASVIRARRLLSDRLMDRVLVRALG